MSLRWVFCSLWFIFSSSLSHFGLFCIAHQFGLDYTWNFIVFFLDHSFDVVDLILLLSLWFSLELMRLCVSCILWLWLEIFQPVSAHGYHLKWGLIHSCFFLLHSYIILPKFFFVVLVYVLSFLFPDASEKRVINSILVAFLERHVPTVTSLAMSGDRKNLAQCWKWQSCGLVGPLWSWLQIGCSPCLPPTAEITNIFHTHTCFPLLLNPLSTFSYSLMIFSFYVTPSHAHYIHITLIFLPSSYPLLTFSHPFHTLHVHLLHTHQNFSHPFLTLPVILSKTTNIHHLSYLPPISFATKPVTSHFSLYTTTYPFHSLCSLMHSYHSYIHHIHLPLIHSSSNLLTHTKPHECMLSFTPSNTHQKHHPLIPIISFTCMESHACGYPKHPPPFLPVFSPAHPS